MEANRSQKHIEIWLWGMIFMVFLMVLIGGITRLTDSGLSMVDWRPLMGAIPPLTDIEWNKVFTDYKAFPEYKVINKGMSLSEFKYIFFWEYFHRLWGRLIGLVFFIPFVIFYFKKYFTKSLTKKLCIAFLLGGMQGLMGWYMVKSGLVNKPDVSHYRLAAHLTLAFSIIGYIFWLLLELKYPHYKYNQHKKLKAPLVLFLFVLILQIVYGGFVAGLDAGLTYNTFPKMGQGWIPRDSMFMTPYWVNLFENTGTIQFIHRCMGWLLLFLGTYLFISSRSENDFLQRKSFQFIGICLIFQFLLGVLTIVNYVPVSIASMHQIGACLLLLLTLRAVFFTFKTKV